MHFKSKPITLSFAQPTNKRHLIPMSDRFKDELAHFSNAIRMSHTV